MFNKWVATQCSMVRKTPPSSTRIKVITKFSLLGGATRQYNTVTDVFKKH